MDRRSFLTTMLAACAAPAIVRADSLMRIVPRELTVAGVGVDYGCIRIGSRVLGLGDVITMMGRSGIFMITAVDSGGALAQHFPDFNNRLTTEFAERKFLSRGDSVRPQKP